MKPILTAVAVVAMTAVGGLWLAPTVHAASLKECQTEPPNANAGFTQESHAACGSQGTDETAQGGKKNSQGQETGVK